jgi:hypothetical protein
MKKKKKVFPMDGPPLLIQNLRLGLVERTHELMSFWKEWHKNFAAKDGRPETVEAYRPPHC